MRRLTTAMLLLSLSLLHASPAAAQTLIGRTISTEPNIGIIPFNGLDFNVNVDGDAFPVNNNFPLADPLFDPVTFVQNPGTDNILEGGTSPGDGFGVFQRRQDLSDPLDPIQDGLFGLPFALGDDSLSIFTGDTVGIVRGGDPLNGVEPDTAPFFGVVDTVNGDTEPDGAMAGTQIAEWRFDISGSSGDLTISIDIAAVGDFEDPEDFFSFTASVDGGTASEIIAFTVDEDATQEIFLEGTPEDAPITIADPLSANGTELNNNFQTISVTIPGGSDTLALQFQALADGGAEAVAFRNILIEDGAVVGPGADAGDFNGDGVVNAADFTVFRDGGPLANETVSPGIVDLLDYNEFVANFGAGSASATGPASVPEPTAFVLLALGLAGAAVRRR